MWGDQLPLEAGGAGPAAVTVGQRELSLSDVWDSLMEGHWPHRALRHVGMMLGVGDTTAEGAARRGVQKGGSRA